MTIEFDCFETTDRVGGQWHTGYDALHLITPRDSSGFTGRPMPASYPLYPSRDQMRDYLLGFAAARDLVRHVTFGTTVDRIAPDGRGWLVETSDAETRRYAGVVVANGHLRVPLQPQLEGYTGRQLHAATYQSTADIEGTRVLVVGSGNSGCDIAVDCAQQRGLATTVSIRKGHLFQPKTFAGKPRGELWIMRLPPRLQDYALRTMIRIAVGRPEEYGLPAPTTWRLTDQKPIVNSQLLHWIPSSSSCWTTPGANAPRAPAGPAGRGRFPPPTDARSPAGARRKAAAPRCDPENPPATPPSPQPCASG